MVARFTDRVAVITGGCSGMGAATVHRFIEEGAKVVILDIQADRGDLLQTELGDNAFFFRGDIRREEDIAGAITQAQRRFGGLDILFNNAAATGTHLTIQNMKASEWDDAMNLILRSVMFGIKHAAPLMIQRGGGSIINTTSVAGIRAQTGPAAYSVAKAGVIHLTKIAAAELAPHRIRVNAICPGATVTEIIGDSLGASREQSRAMMPDVERVFETIQPYPRAGQPKDIAEACLFLASDAAEFVTAAEIVVDGGLLNMPPASYDPTRGAPQAVSEIKARYVNAQTVD